jgi:hypothetical protein
MLLAGRAQPKQSNGMKQFDCIYARHWALDKYIDLCYKMPDGGWPGSLVLRRAMANSHEGGGWGAFPLHAAAGLVSCCCGETLNNLNRSAAVLLLVLWPCFPQATVSVCAKLCPANPDGVLRKTLALTDVLPMYRKVRQRL